MKKAEIKKLSRFLDDPARAEGTFSFHELQGFLFAIAASPETIAPSAWLPLLSDDEGLIFADIEEAREITNLVMALYNEVNAAVRERSRALPAGCALDEDLLRNFEDDSSISQWSRGFASGHDWLSEVWDKYLPDELEEECGATMLVLSFFGSRRLAQGYFSELKRGKGKRGDETFEDFAKTMSNLFPGALASYANLGRTIFEARMELDAEKRKPAVSEKVGRNEPCPCGSGKKYKKCCGGVLH